MNSPHGFMPRAASKRSPMRISATPATAISAGARTARCVSWTRPTRTCGRVRGCGRRAAPSAPRSSISTSPPSSRLSQAISEEIDLEKLIDTLMVIALEHAGADRGLLILSQDDELLIEAEAKTVRDTVDVDQRRSRISAEELPESVLRYVTRTRESVLLDDAAHENPFSEDAYFDRARSRSILCLPLTKQAKLVGCSVSGEHSNLPRLHAGAHRPC